MEVTLKQAYDLFLFDRETYCKQKTIQNYKNTLSYFFNYLENDRGKSIDNILLSDVTTMDLKGYVVMLRNRDKLQNHPYKPTVSQPITKRSIRTYLVDVRTFFHFCYNNSYMDIDIMRGFHMIKSENKLVLPLFADEMAQIDDLFNRSTYVGLRDYLIVHLMVDEGLRSGDVCAIQCDAINFDSGHIVLINGKGDKDRIVPLARRLRQPLYKYLTFFRPHSNMHNYLFCSVRNVEEPLSQDAIKALFARIRRETGLSRLKPHLLRHTFATSFVLGGGDMESLRIFLGHSSYETTQNYLHLANTYSRMGSEIYRLDSVFFRSYYARGYDSVSQQK